MKSHHLVSGSLARRQRPRGTAALLQPTDTRQRRRRVLLKKQRWSEVHNLQGLGRHQTFRGVSPVSMTTINHRFLSCSSSFAWSRTWMVAMKGYGWSTVGGEGNCITVIMQRLNSRPACLGSAGKTASEHKPGRDV